MSCEKTLRNKGLRLTPQRRMIVDIIHHNPEHLMAEDIINHVQKHMPGVNKSTIYRTLDLLEQAGCVYKSSSGNGHIYHHAEEGHHHHLICEKCGCTMDCEDDLFAPVEKALARTCGFRVDFKHVVIKGTCRDCQERK